MLLSTTTDYLSRIYSLEESLEILANAGFKAYDFSCFSGNKAFDLVESEYYKERAQSLRKYADDLKLVCNQSHAFFHSSTGDSEKDRVIYERILRDMEVASILGAKIIIVHPKQHLPYSQNAEALFRMNVEFYKSLIPYCRKFGIKVAMENMFQWNSKGDCALDSTCSRAAEFCRYMDAVNSEWIVGCLDIGHTALIDKNLSLPEFIKELGPRRIKALHIHDNNARYDLHTLPFTQSLDFDGFVSALAEIGYEGDFTYEADSFLAKFPKELMPAASKFMCEVGEYLVGQFKAKK